MFSHVIAEAPTYFEEPKNELCFNIKNNDDIINQPTVEI